MKWNGKGRLWIDKKQIKTGEEIPADLEGKVASPEARKGCGLKPKSKFKKGGSK